MENTSDSMHQHHKPLKILGMLLLASIIMVSILRDRIVNNPQWQVTVTGQGKVTYVPDIATITLGVQIDKAATAQSALRLLNDRINRIIPAITKAGIPAEDIQTQNYSLYPQYDYQDNISLLTGYNANQQLTVKVRNFKNDSPIVSNVIDEASKAGVNQVSGIVFDASNLNELRQQARVKAISDAREKASGLANAAGVRLGKIVGWYENFVQGPGVPYLLDGKGGGGAVSAPQVPVGTQELVIEMGVNYKIK